MLSLYRDLYRELQAGRGAVLVMQPALARGWLWSTAAEPPPGCPPAALARAAEADQSGQLRFGVEGEECWLAEPFRPPSRLVILGGGHIGQVLAEFAAQTGFTVTVVDDRPAFADAARFPRAEQVCCAPFPSCLEQLGLNSATFLVIVTRGHGHDLACLRAALGYRLAYLGMIGSRRRVEATRQQLLAEGCSAAQLAKLHAPIGLEIGAIGPAEIAVAILAELIACKRRPEQDELAWPDCDLAVLRELVEGPAEPRALATVVAALGSVPRGPGAKLLVWDDGRSLGSVGGGYGEAEVIHLARRLLRDGGTHRLHHLELTAELAAEEGMACGGRLQVLIQALRPQAGPAVDESTRHERDDGRE